MQAVSAVADNRHTNETVRSGCPVSLGLDIFGDRWTLLIVRDLMFGGKRHYREILQSAERISSNILADRLQMLLTEGIISKTEDPSHAQKVIYSLTEKGIALLPILMEISRWSFKYRPVGDAYTPPLEQPDRAADWEGLMIDLCNTHRVKPTSDATPTPTD